MATKPNKIVPITAAPSAGKPKTGTAVTTKKSGSVVSIVDALRAQAEAVSSKTAPASGNAIRVTQDKQFILPDGTKTNEPLQLVIVDFITHHKFWEGKFDPANITSTACFAIGDSPLNMTPSDNSPLKQAENCQVCPNNQFGSDGKGKACKNTRVLAVLPPDADENTPLWTLTTSPTANKGFDGFVNGVARVFKLPPVGIIATVGFEENETYARLTFSDPQPNPNVGIHYARQAEAIAMLTQEPDTSQFVPAVKVPARNSKIARR